MIIKIFKVSTKEMYTFPNKQSFYEYVRLVSGMPLMYSMTIDNLMNSLPVEDYCRVK